MFIRFFLLCCFAPSVLAAGLTIDVDLDMEIAEIRYTEPDNTNLLDSTINGGDDRLLAYEESPSGELRKVFIQNNEGSPQLQVVEVISGSNSQEYIATIPAFSVDELFFLEGELYAFTFDHKIYTYDQNGSTWVDLATLVAMPVGAIEYVKVIGGNLVFSVKEGETESSWGYSNSTLLKLSDTLMSDALIWPSNDGLVQVTRHDEGGSIWVKKLTWLETNKEPLTLLNQGVYDIHIARVGDNGTLHMFYDSNYAKFFWDDVNDEHDRWFALSNKVTLFKGCFASFGSVFCGLSTDEQKLSIYRLNEGKFVVDSSIPFTETFTASSYIRDIVAIDQTRIFMTEGETVRHLIENDNGAVTSHEVAAGEEANLPRIIESKQSPKIYLDLKFQFETLLSDLEGGFSGDAYAPFINTGEGELLQLDYDGSEPEERVVKETIPDKPNAELSGSFSLFVILNMLLLLSFRRRQ